MSKRVSTSVMWDRYTIFSEQEYGGKTNTDIETIKESMIFHSKYFVFHFFRHNIWRSKYYLNLCIIFISLYF